MTLKFTLDTNCIIDVDEDRPSAEYIKQIVDAHQKNLTDVAVPYIGASERQKNHGYHATSTDFDLRLARLGLDHLKVLQPMAYFDVTFLDGSLLSDGPMIALERQVHSILFSHIEFDYQNYCKKKGIDELPVDSKWRNVKCDVQAMWCHLHYTRNIFITSDQNFHRKAAQLSAIGAGRILFPETAAKLLGAP